MKSKHVKYLDDPLKPMRSFIHFNVRIRLKTKSKFTIDLITSSVAEYGMQCIIRLMAFVWTNHNVITMYVYSQLAFKYSVDDLTHRFFMEVFKNEKCMPLVTSYSQYCFSLFFGFCLTFHKNCFLSLPCMLLCVKYFFTRRKGE